MVPGAERMMTQLEHLNELSGPVFKIKNDPRITRVGKYLRKTSIDELPQLINVFRGDMSLVGPRPMSVRDFEKFDQDWQRRRFSVRPGITCLWQVNGRNSIPFEKWMELDMDYIDRWTLGLDFRILIKTIPAVLKGSGACLVKSFMWHGEAMMSKRIKVAFLGSRGIPACYGGYETLIEELSLGLTASGAADVLVYCRTGYFDPKPPIYNGVRLVYLPSPRSKAIESLIHSFLSTVHVLGQKVDLIYFVDPANAPFCILLRLFRKTVIIHTDGLGWKRKKWGKWARRYYKFVEWICARTATALVTDNPAMREYYRNEYNADSCYIPYGAEQHSGEDHEIYGELGLSQKQYLLVVARLERDNNVDLIIREYTRSNVEMPLVIVGDAPYDPAYLALLHALSNNRVLFVGRISDQARLNSLYSGAYLYIHGHEVGGTNPSLLRAMNAGAAPLTIDVDFNRFATGDSAFVFSRHEGNLSDQLKYLVTNPSLILKVSERMLARVKSHFTWDGVVRAHTHLFSKLISREIL